MMKRQLVMAVLLLHSLAAYAEEPAAAEAEPPAAKAPAANTGTDGQAKTMSGMSILGNEEAPKALVIVPWKSSEMGEDLSLRDTLDERATPVDREVFARELAYYQLRSASQ